MPRNFDELRRQVDEELARHPDGEQIREQIREQVQRELEAELAAHAVSLQELRRARAMTQTQLANALEVSQAQVSRIEKQADLLLSTLVSYVEAMGGELEIVARFPDHPPAYLTIGEMFGHDTAEIESAASTFRDIVAEKFGISPESAEVIVGEISETPRGNAIRESWERAEKQ